MRLMKKAVDISIHKTCLRKRTFRMKMKIIVLLICSLFLCASLTNCGGGGAKVESNMSTQTLGQQLIDLDKAFKEGVLTEKEYKKSKAALLKKYK
jgi:hypothetical protein